MCTLLIAIDQHPAYRLIVAANRDEFYDRATAPAGFWAEAPDLFAGRDLVRGGTWLGVTTAGRIAALTNYREPHPPRSDAPSRGHLVTGYLTGEESAEEYLQRLGRRTAAYSGYNLIAGDPDTLYYQSNRSEGIIPLRPGLYGLSNHLLDTPWPKVERGKAALARLLRQDKLSPEEIFPLLSDTTKAPDDEVPDTGVGLEWERLLSSIFIESERYGTRSSTVLMVDEDRQATLIERSYDGGEQETRQSFDWSR